MGRHQPCVLLWLLGDMLWGLARTEGSVQVQRQTEPEDERELGGAKFARSRERRIVTSAIVVAVESVRGLWRGTSIPIRRSQGEDWPERPRLLHRPGEGWAGKQPGAVGAQHWISL